MSQKKSIALGLLLGTASGFGQRLYNEANDRKATEALGLSQQVLSGQVWEKALGNLDELFKGRQQFVFDSAEGIVKAEWATWKRWTDVKDTFDRQPAPATASDAAFKREIQRLAVSRAEAEAQLDRTRGALLEAKGPGQVKLVALWLERIGSAKPLIDRALALEGTTTASKANLDAAAAAKRSLDGLAELYRNFNVDIPAETAGTIFLEGQIQLLELEQAHMLRLAAIQERLQVETEALNSLRVRGESLLNAALEKFPDATIKDSFERARTEAPALIADMASALHYVAAYAARANLPRRLAAHRESLEIRAQGIRRDAANAALYERTITNGIQRLASYHKGGIKPQDLAALIRSISTAGIIPAIATR